MTASRLLLVGLLALGGWSSTALARVEASSAGRATEIRSAAMPADTDTVAPAAPADTDEVAPPTGTPGQEARPDTLEREETRAEAAARELETRRQALSREGFPERDELFLRLTRLSGFRVVEYRGEAVELEVQREAVELSGEAQANYAASVLEADSISYLADLQFLRARGAIRLLNEGREVESDSSLYYDISSLKGTILGARTVFAERGAEWYVRGTATPKGQRTVFVQRGTFTTCELGEPHYWFKAGRIKVVSDNYIVASSVVFYVHGIPLVWLPFFAQDIRPGRRSGFIPPRFGFNDIVETGNTARSINDVGYFFAINPFMDARFTVDWLSGRFTRLNGDFRYNFLKKFFEGSVRTSYSFGDDGRTYRVDARHDQELTPNTDFRANVSFVQNTRLFESRSFDPVQQTQDIDTDVGFNHRFDFATVNASFKRQQRLGTQTGLTDLELPQFRMTFSPITLFRAPAGRSGPFNDLTWNGNLGFNRQVRLNEEGDDRTTTTANFGNSIRLGRLNVSGSTNLTDIETTPLDSLGVDGDAFSRTTITWNTSADFQVDLMGSTVLRPTVEARGAQFKSPETRGMFISAPTRLDLGATLRTDLFAFLPGFGPFSTIRHKVSPTFNYFYSPAVEVADSLLEIPGFPGGNVREQNRLNVRLAQTFEAKVKPRRPSEDDGREEDPPAAGADPVATEGDERTTEAGERRSPSAAVGAGARAQAASQERKIVLLAINSDPLQFDFARENEPSLVTDRWGHSITSDLLRGFAFNMALDLFEGFGEERDFSPILQQVTGSFSVNSQSGLSGLFGIREPRRATTTRPSRRDDPRRGQDARYRRSGFGEGIDEEPLEEGVAGPWNLGVQYSLTRPRASESAERERQSLGGILQLAPTANWRVRWQTQYDLTEGEFVSNSVFLERDLHRWQAFFGFAESPNGNFQFQVMVNLRDAPELRVDWDQQTLTGR